MRTMVFIDAANLFYGGLKSLGWKIDYQKLKIYLLDKYQAQEIHYFGGVEIYDFQHDSIKNQSVHIGNLSAHLNSKLKNFMGTEKDLIKLNKNYKRTKFFLKLESFGYSMILKPIKTYKNKGGLINKKADCDVDLVMKVIENIDYYNRAIVLSGDLDFLPLYKFLKNKSRGVKVLAHSKNTAREIKKFLGQNFVEFKTLRSVCETK